MTRTRPEARASSNGVRGIAPSEAAAISPAIPRSFGGIPVDLVAVVAGWVVACRDHHAPGRIGLQDRVREDGGRNDVAEDEHGNPHRRRHLDHVALEYIAVRPRVPTDAEAAVLRVGQLLQQPRTEPGRGLRDRHSIHACWPRPEEPAQARRSKSHRTGEPIFEAGEIPFRKQPFELGSRFGIRIGCHPGPRIVDDAHIDAPPGASSWMYVRSLYRTATGMKRSAVTAIAAAKNK